MKFVNREILKPIHNQTFSGKLRPNVSAKCQRISRAAIPWERSD